MGCPIVGRAAKPRAAKLPRAEAGGWRFGVGDGDEETPWGKAGHTRRGVRAEGRASPALRAASGRYAKTRELSLRRSRHGYARWNGRTGAGGIMA